MGERNVAVEVVSRLIHEQFPQWADLRLQPVELSGWDNTTFRLGDRLLVRLPNEDTFVEQIRKEQRWLPILAEYVPFSIPTPIGYGWPGCGFLRPWSIYGWVDGKPVEPGERLDFNTLAADLATFLSALHRVPVLDGPIPGEHNYQRGGPLAVFDSEARAAIRALRGRINSGGALDVWDAALAATGDGRDVWIHGDLTGSNILTSSGHLSGVLDFGCCAIGDPACDLGVAWTLFDRASRDEFVRSVDVDRNAWARARGWILWKAVKGLCALPEDHPRNNGIRLGWRWPSIEVITRLI